MLSSGPPTELDAPRRTERDAGPDAEQVSSEEPDYGLPTARDGASSERTVREPAPLDTTLRSEPSARPPGRGGGPRASDRSRAHLAATMPSATDEVTRGRQRLAELEARTPVVVHAEESLTTTLASEVPSGSESARTTERARRAAGPPPPAADSTPGLAFSTQAGDERPPDADDTAPGASPTPDPSLAPSGRRSWLSPWTIALVLVVLGAILVYALR
ncbi:MAG: hypothetical protein IT373_24725 [Polyangiaceae bacterium]|nr:hypothetical protein [Polyangiaceae bacterium]